MYGNRLFICRFVSLRSFRFYTNNTTKKLLEFLAEMPKANSGRIAEAQRQRLNIQKKGDKYGCSTVYLQVLGSGARGVPNTLYLFTDQKRYLFNCGECTQRLAHEHKVKLSRLDHIFITNKSWQNIGGLPGLSLTLQDVGVPNITLHGPEGLDELYNATKRFVIMKDMNVTMAPCEPRVPFEDNVMSVKYVRIGPKESILKPAAKKAKLSPSPTDKEFEEFLHDDTDYYRRDRAGPKERTRPKSPEPKKKSEKVQETSKANDYTVAYICTLTKRLGTLDLAKCVELGVKPGPALGQLKGGQDVVLPNGNIVRSRDVKTPDDPGPVFIVLEVLQIDHLNPSEFEQYFDNGRNPADNVPAVVVHYTPPHVLNHASYRAFMSNFGPNTQHLVLNEQNSCLGSEAVHRTQHKLHLLDPDIFPLLRDVSVPAVWDSRPVLPNTGSPIRLKVFEDLKKKFQNIISLEASSKEGLNRSPDGTLREGNEVDTVEGRTLTIFHLRPRKELDRTSEPKLHIQSYIQEAMDVDGFSASLDQFRQVASNLRYAKNDPTAEYPKVVFLGTGSCIPSKTRNTSGIVLQIDENTSMLLDCGEGTFGQLVRFYGPKRVNAFLRTLKAIYVSHLHADHHIGLIGVIQARRRALLESKLPPDPVYLFAPGQIMSWLTMYDQQFERIRADFTLIPNQGLLYNATYTPESMSPAVLASLNLRNIETCLVAHCPNAFGVSLSIDSQHKITYSGDTIPCDELIVIGKNSSLLIHEATMEDELADEARTKMHSTTSQAIETGYRMNAKYTVLTHFSQRYARLPRLSPHILNDNHCVGIAFDNMQINMNDLELLPQMYAPLQLMFAEHCVEMELKAAHRARQRERRSDDPRSRSQTHSRDTSVTRSCSRNSSVKRRQSTKSVRSFRSHASYIESNASILRQACKGMAVSGTIRPHRNSAPASKCTLRSTKPRETASSVRTSNGVPEGILKTSTLPRKQKSSNVKDESSKESFYSSSSIGNSIVFSDYPTSEATSYRSRSQPQSRTSSCMFKGNSDVIDCRSRTLNKVSNSPSRHASPILCNKTNSGLRQVFDGTGYGLVLGSPTSKNADISERDLSGVATCNCKKLPPLAAFGVRTVRNGTGYGQVLGSPTSKKNADRSNTVTKNTFERDLSGVTTCTCKKLSELGVASCNCKKLSPLGVATCNCKKLSPLGVATCNCKKLSPLGVATCNCKKLSPPGVATCNCKKLSALGVATCNCKKRPPVLAFGVRTVQSNRPFKPGSTLEKLPSHSTDPWIAKNITSLNRKNLATTNVRFAMNPSIRTDPNSYSYQNSRNTWKITNPRSENLPYKKFDRNNARKDNELRGKVSQDKNISPYRTRKAESLCKDVSRQSRPISGNFKDYNQKIKQENYIAKPPKPLNEYERQQLLQESKNKFTTKAYRDHSSTKIRRV